MQIRVSNSYTMKSKVAKVIRLSFCAHQLPGEPYHVSCFCLFFCVLCFAVRDGLCQVQAPGPVQLHLPPALSRQDRSFRQWVQSPDKRYKSWQEIQSFNKSFWVLTRGTEYWQEVQSPDKRYRVLTRGTSPDNRYSTRVFESWQEVQSPNRWYRVLTRDTESRQEVQSPDKM